MLIAVLTPNVVKADFPVRTDKLHVYKVWCRHDALYWGSVVGEDLQVRVAIGRYNDGKYDALHAQPQVKILDTWYYFKARPYMVEGDNQAHIEMIIISMPKQVGHTWLPLYNVTWAEFSMIQNTWMVQENGRNFDLPASRKAWNKKMNKIFRILRNRIPEDIIP
jgi:hypothetical protein